MSDAGGLVGTIAVAGAMTAGAQLVHGRHLPPPTIVLGTAVTAIVLVQISHGAPELARKIATLVLLTSFLVNGAPIALAVTKYLSTGGGASAAAASTASTTAAVAAGVGE